MAEHPPIDRWRFDAIANGPERLWGIETIAGVLGVCGKTVKRWVADPSCDVPIRKLEGRFFALRSELVTWMQAR